MDPAHVDALIGSATETEEDEEELVVVEERTDSGSPTSGEYEEFEEFEEVSASSEGAAAPAELEAQFGEMHGKLAALRARMEAKPPPRPASDASLDQAASPTFQVAAPSELPASPTPDDDHGAHLSAAKTLPRRYAVKAPGALIRAGVEMASAKVKQLAPHDMIVVEEVSVAPEGVPRCRISSPVAGWLSCKCVQGGEALAVIAMRPPTPPGVEETKTQRRDPLRDKRADPQSPPNVPPPPPKSPPPMLEISPATSPETPQKMEALQEAAKKIVEADQTERRAKAREDILAFYARHNAEKVPGADKLIEKYKEQGVHEPELLDAIVKKYTREGRLVPADEPETPLSPDLKSPSLKVPVTPAEAARIRAVVLPKDEISVAPSPSRSPMSRRKHVFPSPTVPRKLDAEPREINRRPADAKAPTYERKPLNEDSPLRRAWAKGLTPSSPAAVPKKDAVNASPKVAPVSLKQDRGADPEALLDAVFGGGDDDGGATPARSEPLRTPVSSVLLRSARSPEHPLSAGKGAVEVGGGPPGSPWSPGAAAAPAVMAPAAPVAAAATTPAAQPAAAETARTPTSQASSEQKAASSSQKSKDTPSAASATDSAVLPADAAAAIARARAEANAPQQPFAAAVLPPAPTPLGDEALRAAFEAADANSNGEVSIIEAIKALRANADFARALGLEPQHVKQEDGSRDKFIRAFGAFDGDGDKRLTFSEFRAGYRALVEERENEEKQHRRSDSQERFVNRLKFWGGSPGSSPSPSPVPALAIEARPSRLSFPTSSPDESLHRRESSFGDDVAFLARVAGSRRSSERSDPPASRRSSERSNEAPAPAPVEPDSDDESSGSSAVIELPVHRPQASTTSPTVIPKLSFTKPATPELPPPPPPPPEEPTRDTTPVARHDSQPVFEPIDAVSPLSAASPFRLNRRPRFWAKPAEGVKSPTPRKPKAKKVLLERRTNYMRFGATKLDKKSKRPSPTIPLSPATRKSKKQNLDYFDETAAARCYTEGLRMAEDARDLFERLIADDPASPPVSPASTRSEAFSIKSPVKTAPAWKMGYTNTAHELRPKFRGGAV